MSATAPYPEDRRSGIPHVGTVPWGTHFCQFYQSESDLVDVLVPYFKAGLEDNEYCLWVAPGPLDVAACTKALEAAVPGLEERRRRGQIEVISGEQWHASGGNPDDHVASALDLAMTRGFDGLRLSCPAVTGGRETSPCPGVDIVPRHNILAAFLYPRDDFDALALMEVVKNHRFALIRNAGKWEIIESSEARTVKDALKRTEEKLEALFSNMSEGFAYHRVMLDGSGRPCDYVFLQVNEAFERLTGLTADTIIGRKVTEVLPGIERDSADWIGRYGRVAMSGRPAQFEDYAAALQKWFSVSAFSPHKAYFAATFSDITERKRMEAALRESEERYRTTIASIGDGVIATDSAGNIAFMNSVAEELTGWSLGDAATRPVGEVFNIVNEFTRLRVDCPVAKVLREGTIVGLANHTILIRKDGSEVAIDDSGAPIRGRDGSIMGAVLVFRDMTERRRAEEALRKSEELARARSEELEKVLDAAPAAVWVAHDPKGQHITGNRLSYEWLNLPPGAEASKSAPPGERPETFRLFKDGKELQPEEMPVQLSAMGKGIRDFEFTFVYPDNAERHVLGNAVPLFDDDGRPRGSVSSFIDITGRKKAEEDVKKSMERLDIISTTASQLLMSQDPKGVVDTLCQRVMEHLDCQAFFNFLVDDEKNCLRLNAYAGIPEESAREIRFLDYGVAVCGCAARDGCRIVAENIPFVQDVRTDLVRSFGIKAYAAHPLFAQGRVIGTLSFGTKSRLTFTDDELSLMKTVADQVATAVERVRLFRAAEWRAEELERRVQERTVELQEAYDRLVRETREREQIESQLRQAQKMEALGTLAGGIAHDFNNILAAIIGFTEIARDRTAPESGVQRQLERVFEAGIRGRELVKHMLTFSRRGEQEKKPLPLSSIVTETIKLLRASIPTTIGIRVNVKSESGFVFADPVQMQQVVMNLCANGAYAMREKGGMLRVELSDFSVSPRNGDHHGLKPGLYMKLTVSDTGTGMSPEIVGKIFDPFFTTKKAGEGTGLGLSVVHGIVKQHDGHITVESDPGAGSAFSVYLPKVGEGVRLETMTEEAIPTGHARVLFVDDEEALIEMGQELLEELGYVVTVKQSSVEALSAFRADPTAYDLIITDQTMPEMTGVEFATEVLSLKADMPVILCTGFSHNVDSDKARAAGISAFMMKPLTKAEMARTIRRVLEVKIR